MSIIERLTGFKDFFWQINNLRYPKNMTTEGVQLCDFDGVLSGF